MKALFLTLSLIFVLDASAAGQTKKKKKDSMWATDLRERLAKPATSIRTWQRVNITDENLAMDGELLKRDFKEKMSSHMVN